MAGNAESPSTPDPVKYFAHTLPHTGTSSWEAIETHLLAVSRSAEAFAAELGTDHKSTWNILRPLIEAGIVEMNAHPTGGAMYSFSGVLGEVG